MPEITETEKAKKGDAKVHQTMHEFKHGTLHSGSKKGPKVTNRRQAIAIALSQAGRASKAANYGAHVGQAIAGNLFRGTGGQFTGGAGGASAAAPAKSAPAPKPSKADTSARQREARQALADQQRQERQSARDQAKTDAQQKAVQNVGDLAEKLLDSDLAEVLTAGDTPGDISEVNPEYGDKLVARGLATKYPDGTYDTTPTGRAMVNAMKKGNERQAKVAIMRAQALADRKAQAAARRAKRGKKEQFALAIKAANSFTAYKNYAQKDFFGLDVPEVQEEPEHTGVMVAFYIDTFSPDAAVQLQVPGGETWDALHLTLAYLGDSTELGPDVEKELYRWISEFARSSSPLEGTVNGTGLFIGTEEGEGNAFVALFDSPALPAFRTRLIEVLQVNGIEPVQNHGFTPHITLQYLEPGQPQPVVEAIPMPMIFTKVTVKWGDKRMDFSLGLVTKEVKNEIAAKELSAKPFTAYKDASGRWRWLVRSSSAFLDRDGETVSQKALEGAVAKLNSTGRFGILDWWHTPVKLGTCDFSAMHGRVLVESGTFTNERVGERISSVIANKELDPGVSLMFAHNRPGPQVVPGRVFDDIEIIQRALVPENIAANAVTTMEIINLAAKSGATTKEVVLKMDAHKEQKLKELLGADLVEQFLSGSALAEKSLELAGLSYKAMSPVPPPPPLDPTKKKLDMKADGIMAAAAGPDAPVEGSPEEEAAETPEEEAAEPPDPGEEGDMAGGDADQIIQGLYDEVDAIIGRRMQSTADEIVAKLSSIKAVSSKETDEALSVMTIALKENTAALSTVIAENAALKASIAALEGKQPPVVAQRASAAKSNQVTDPKLLEALKEQNKPQLDANDPFKAMYEGWIASGAELPLNR